MTTQTCLTSAVAAVILALALSACSPVLVREPIGEAPYPVQREEWEGEWIHEDGLTIIRVADETEGILFLSGLEEKEEEALRLETLKVTLRQSGGWVFASLRDETASAKEDEYVWGRVRKADNLILVWLPDSGKFERLIEEGILPGSTDDGVLLTDLKKEHYEIITSEAQGVLFEWDEPMILRRVPR
jgi:hypothetical protein